MNEQEYIAVVTAIADEAYRIKDNKPVFGSKNQNNADSTQKPLTEPLIEDPFRICHIMEIISTTSLFSLFGRKWRSCITTILSLVELFKFRTSNTEITYLSFPTHSRYLTDVFGDPKGVWRTIKRCEEIGLIACVNPNYRFGVKDSYAKLYAWNKDVERAVLKFCKENNIKANVKHSITMKRILEDFQTKANDSWKEKAKGLVIKITQKTALPETLTDEEVIEAVLTRYPEIRDAMETAIRLNKILPEHLQISCIPNINRCPKSQRITKIGFRITNPIVSAKVHDNQNDDYHGVWLKDILKEKFGEWIEYDVKSSIYRVTHLLNFGEWLPETVDFYNEIAGFDFPAKENRDHFKLFCMSLYFCNTANSILASYERKSLALDIKREVLLNVIEEARARMWDVCGPSFQSEVFVAESCIYLEAYRRMVEEKGWTVAEIYDGFNIQKKEGMDAEAIRSEAARIIEESAYWYYNKYKRV